MTRRSLANVTLIALIVSCFAQIGAQLFAIYHRPCRAISPATLLCHPGRTVPLRQQRLLADCSADHNGTLSCRSHRKLEDDRRKLLLGAFTLFLIGGVVAGVYLEPMFAKMIAIGYRDVVDPDLQARAATWYALDWGVWVLGLAAGIALLCALARPATNSRASTTR